MRSPPVWVAWIEILMTRRRNGRKARSPPVWVAWIEIKKPKLSVPHPQSSPPVWVAWIEIPGKLAWQYATTVVATRMGGVD